MSPDMIGRTRGCDKEGVTYPDNCLSKLDFPGKSLFETTFPVDSLFSLASLWSTDH